RDLVLARARGREVDPVDVLADGRVELGLVDRRAGRAEAAQARVGGAIPGAVRLDLASGGVGFARDERADVPPFKRRRLDFAAQDRAADGDLVLQRRRLFGAQPEAALEIGVGDVALRLPRA